MKRKIVATLAVRNNGSRLYGKPLQNLDIDNELNILDFLITGLNKLNCIDSVVLCISEGSDNGAFIDYAKNNSLNYVVGDEKDVLGRLILGAKAVNATDVFRVTSESPFPYYEAIEESSAEFLENGYDALFFDEIIDGCGFEFISLSALEHSHSDGNSKHRSEMCTLYIRENKEKFKLLIKKPTEKFQRKDLRLTVDFPEDLIVCRAVYEKFKGLGPHIPVSSIIDYLDENQHLKEMVMPFTEQGYSTMYK